MNRQTLSSIIKLFAIAVNKREDKNIGEISEKFKMFLSETIESQYIDIYMSVFEKDLEEYASFSSKRLSLNSVRLIHICSETCAALSADNRITVLFHLMELLSATSDEQSDDFVELVAEIYEIGAEKLNLIRDIFACQPTKCHTIANDGKLVGLYTILSRNLLVIKPLSNKISINGQTITTPCLTNPDKVISVCNQRKIYAKDLWSPTGKDTNEDSFDLIINNLSVTRKHKMLLHPQTCRMHSGELIGIMGRSGSGKTTMLKAIAGMGKSSGEIFKRTANGDSTYSIAYLPQANSMIPLFSVRQHIEQRLDFIQFAEDYTTKVNDLLAKVELTDFADNIAAKADGTPWQISGGQQKRLGIAMEMATDPEVFVLDEPTSGLSSADSQKIIGLLKSIAEENKVVIASIHQPDYDTFIMFDKILIIDDGGYSIFYGKPTAAADYFHQKAGKIDRESLIETRCNPAVILNTINEKSHDEHGNTTGNRNISPEKWSQMWSESNEAKHCEQSQAIKVNANVKPQNNFKSFCKQLRFSFRCDFRNKIRVALIIAIAPLMSILMSMLTRFSPGTEYSYFSNPNIPAWLMMLLIIGFFLGLVISGHEFIFLRQFHQNEHIICDKRTSLALAKITKYMMLSCIISLLLTLPATIIAENIFLSGKLLIMIWLLTFCGSTISMIVSIFFKNSSTVYLLIPLIVIPQMIFSGGLIQYGNFNRIFVKSDGMPIFANIMPIRWADEACMTDAYMQNPVEREIFDEKAIFYEASKENDNAGKQNAQEKIDRILESIENCDSIYKKYGNMYISKIVTTGDTKSIYPPIYSTQNINSIFLCGNKMLFGNKISTYNYNALILALYNLILCIVLVFCAKRQ